MYFDQRLMPTFSALLHSYNDDELDSPYRSTVPLLALVKDKANTLSAILNDCAISTTGDFHFEFKVSHRSEGRGNSSHTDLMIISDTACVAIESKWTEPAYANIASWLRKGRNKLNREKVLSGWLDLLGVDSTPVFSQEVTGCEYQMLHRAASAYATASPLTSNKHPMLAYFKFTSPNLQRRAASPDYYRAALASLHKRLRLTRFPFLLIEIGLAPTAHFIQLTNPSKGTRASVRTTLEESPLFTFPSYKIEVIAT
ncbi:hypothetical protein JQ616_38960 [Bradyrhizobium tropiciagri]|uniref:DUF6946 family protein n=1 Tax=Bradyrhizobium tropiciagri TaxID=312253 RepID=UPI001BA852C7|nr:hypothetical protein [Bradyrhizobium tropiciagri]MBR0900973.1 hypothetical protein [Bradyrhizobium tropiciagri]